MLQKRKSKTTKTSSKIHLSNGLFRTLKHLRITNQMDEEILDDRKDDGRIVFETEQLIKPYLEADAAAEDVKNIIRLYGV
jgi:hypothetical protein